MPIAPQKQRGPGGKTGLSSAGTKSGNLSEVAVRF